MDIEFIYILLPLIFGAAFLHSSVGLGGGSSYTALFAIWGISATLIPPLSLSLNLIVTSIGTFNFFRHKHGQPRLVLPFLISSTPFAYLGGLIQLPKKIFYVLLAVSLIFVIYRLMTQATKDQWQLNDKQKLSISLVAGALLGLLSGILGIGGGIYLVPLIILLGLGTPKEAAACGAVFIWFNSLSGLSARVLNSDFNPTQYWPFFVTVILGGLIGSSMGAGKFERRTIEKLLALTLSIAVVILVVKSLI